MTPVSQITKWSYRRAERKVNAKRMCHKDIVVLGQFRAKSPSGCLYLNPTCSCRGLEVRGGGGGTNHNNYFAGIAIKIEESRPNFFKFQSALSILAIRRNRLQGTVSMLYYSLK